MAGFLKRLFSGGKKPIDYDRAKDLAAHPNSQVRADLARRGDIRPEILYFLAGDTDPAVRRSVAANDSAPPQANLLLAADRDDEVRGDLATKIARLAPGLSAHDQDRLHRLTYEALEIIARDQIPRIRQILSQALKDVANAPPDVIRRLARDAELVVSGPILRFSPVLTDEDLLEIIGTDPIPGALTAISRRAGINTQVCDAIAATDDVDAIAVLLGNPLAQIREETLDQLVHRAADIEAWHRPFVERPRIPTRVAHRLARFVAADLLRTLADRDDLDPETTALVALMVEKRIGETAHSPEATASNRRAADLSEAEARARALMDGGHLTETTIDTALASGDLAFVTAAVTLLAGMSAKSVAKVVDTQSAKGIIAITWKAGLSSGFSLQLQTRLLRLPPSRVIAPADGDFPLTTREMEWQLEFFDTPE
ncbi:DUF2336 domain-containing protein [Magnetospirillum molischianum]|uniref:DUF2336 domain-containing protein n=1 Tax=Magnetospirillum molischianum DSM 120 TaxID=1150626 RepID=H8FTI1_MAGML|nr:DUF2336 domain-containing protein [Magnetospirillum molischianum]CCG41669.1 conserved hypothetical protein [Magnetospirillum molischianum DSM 120]